MKVIIDRFEGNYAVCEKQNKTMINIGISKIPTNSKQGDVLDIQGDTIVIDNISTKDRQKYINDLVKDLWES